MDASHEIETGIATSHEIAHPKKRAMLSALSQTGNVSAAARAAGIARRTHYDWLASDPSYGPAVDQAMEEAADVLEAVARKRAIVGSDLLLIFLLKAIRPAKFRDRYEAPVASAPPPAPRRSREDLQRDLDEKLDRLPKPVVRRLIKAMEARLSRAPETIEGAFTYRQEF